MNKKIFVIGILSIFLLSSFNVVGLSLNKENESKNTSENIVKSSSITINVGYIKVEAKGLVCDNPIVECTRKDDVFNIKINNGTYEKLTIEADYDVTCEGLWDEAVIKIYKRNQQDAYIAEKTIGETEHSGKLSFTMPLYEQKSFEIVLEATYYDHNWLHTIEKSDSDVLFGGSCSAVNWGVGSIGIIGTDVYINNVGTLFPYMPVIIDVGPIGSYVIMTCNYNIDYVAVYSAASLSITDPYMDFYDGKTTTGKCSGTLRVGMYLKANGNEVRVQLSGLAYVDNTNYWDIKKSYGKTKTYNAPLVPTLEGRSKGVVEKEYDFTATSTDSDGHKIFYKFNWGNGAESEWLGPYDSGVSCTESHQWTTAGTYSVQVTAKDEYNYQSSWSEPLEISIKKTKDKAVTPMLSDIFVKLFDQFPLLKQIFL